MRNLKYIVGNTESQFSDAEFAIVNAPTQREAIEKFIKHIAIKEELFLEHVYGKAVNMSFAEHFWLVTEHENRYFEQGGKVKTARQNSSGGSASFSAPIENLPMRTSISIGATKSIRRPRTLSPTKCSTTYGRRANMAG